MTQLIAVPFVPHPDKLELILDAVCEHRTWFPDALWANPVIRRAAANRRLAQWITQGALWEAWRGDELVGILGVDEVSPGHDAVGHFIFFDRRLLDKVDLCNSVLAWAFETYSLHIVRLEIPTYAKALARFARNKLLFRYEAADRPLSWPEGVRLSSKEAELGSRKHHAQLYEGKWHDALLLSITRDEFQHGWTLSQSQPGLDSSNAGTSGTDIGISPADVPQSGSHDLNAPADAGAGGELHDGSESGPAHL